MCTYDAFIFNFITIYFLSVNFIQTVQNIMPLQTSQNIQISHFEVLSIWKKSYVSQLYCTGQGNPNLAKYGVYDYMAQTRRIIKYF